MKKLTLTSFTLAAVLALSACSSNTDEIAKVPDKSAQALFADARKALDSGLYKKAIQLLSAIDSRFPFGAISHQVQLDLLYAYYKSGDSAQGIALADRFIKLNPTNPQLDYVYYMRGLIHLSMEKNLFQDMFGIDRSDRDPANAKAAFADFNKIVTDYPQSKYAADSQKRMFAVKSRLAKYELAVADFYIKREAWVSAANRARYIVEYYAPSEEVEQALEIMVMCYDKLGMSDLKKNALQVLALNYPNNKLVK